MLVLYVPIAPNKVKKQDVTFIFIVFMNLKNDACQIIKVHHKTYIFRMGSKEFYLEFYEVVLDSIF